MSGAASEIGGEKNSIEEEKKEIEEEANFQVLKNPSRVVKE